MDVTKPNCIDGPIVLILHGMDSYSTFGYVRSMMRTAIDGGWVAVFKKISRTGWVARGENTGHVGDLRIVKRQLKYRLRRSDDVPSTGLFRSASAKSWPWAILSTSNKLTENLYNFLQLNIQLRDDPASK